MAAIGLRRRLQQGTQGVLRRSDPDRSGRFAEAGAVLHHASRLDVHDAESLNLIALMDLRQNRLQDAFEIQTRAISRQPDQPRQYLLLADILEKMGRGEEARAAIAQVTRLQASVRAASIAN